MLPALSPVLPGLMVCGTAAQPAPSALRQRACVIWTLWAAREAPPSLSAVSEVIGSC